MHRANAVRGRAFFHNALASVLQTVATAAVLFVVYRHVHDALGPEALGVWSTVVATVSISRLADLGISASVTRLVALHLARSEEKTAAHAVETAILTLGVALAVLLPSLYIPLRALISAVFHDGHQGAALALLPFSLASLWLSLVAAASQSALDGCQRTDLRAGLGIASGLLFAVGAWLMLPRFGLLGLAWAQIAQGIFVALVGWSLLRSQITGLHRFPHYWSRPLFKDMLRYGANVQTASVLMMLFDPLTKVLMTRFAGPAAAGYFEMANQAVLKARSLLIAANQAIVPRITQTAEVAPTMLKSIYQDNLSAVVLFVVPSSAVLYLCAGFASFILVGEVHEQFVFVFRVSTIGWLVNVLSAPSYFYNLGTGYLRWNTVGHVVMGLVNLALGWAFGQWFGMHGVVVAYGLALALGSLVPMVMAQRRLHEPRAQRSLRDHQWLVAASGALAAVGHIIENAPTHRRPLWYSVAGLLMFLLAVILWRHPTRRALWNSALAGAAQRAHRPG